MALRTLPGLGLNGDWAKGAADWDTGMNENLLKMSALVNLSVLSRTTSLPGSPTDGMLFINPETAPSYGGQIAIRDAGAWVYLAPKEGWVVWVADEKQFVVYSDTGWKVTNFSNPAATVFLNYDQGFTSSWSKIPFNNASVDTTSSFDTGANKYVVPVSGLYCFSVRYQMHVRSGMESANSISFRAMNGVTEIPTSAAESGVENWGPSLGNVSSEFNVSLSAGDEITFEAKHDGASGDQVISANRAVGNMRRVG